MGLDAKRRLDLRHGEELVVRLTTVGNMYRLDGRVERLVGKPRAYHYLHSVRRTVDCRFWNCKICDRGARRIIRVETRLLWELPSGLLECTAFLTRHEHRQFAKAAEIIGLEERDPKEVRLLWRFAANRPKSVEVLFV